MSVKKAQTENKKYGEDKEVRGMRGIHAEGSLCALWCEDSEPAASSLLSHGQIREIPKDAEEGERHPFVRCFGQQWRKDERYRGGERKWRRSGRKKSYKEEGVMEGYKKG